MNRSGYGCVSYQFLAWKAHCCRRTAITQIANLIAQDHFRKTVIRTKEGYAWNLQTGPTDGFHQCGNTRLC
jgi:hypothetical protein